MSLYQTSVLKNHINLQEKEVVEKAYKKYVKYFLNPTIQENKKSPNLKNYKGKEVDAMVYELYGLTDEEIAIVENS